MKRPLFAVGLISLCCTAALAFFGGEWLFAALGFAFLLCAVAMCTPKRRILIIAVMFGVIIAVIGHWIYDMCYIKPLNGLEDTRQTVSGYVVSAKRFDKHYEYIINGNILGVYTPKSLNFKLTAFDDLELEPCQGVEGEVRVVGSDDKYILSQRAKGINLNLRLDDGKLAESKTPPHKSWQYYGAYLRKLFIAQFNEYIPESSEIVSAMMFSDEVVIPSESYNQMARAGVAHVLVVSGMHLSIVVQAVLLLAKALRLKKWITFTGGCGAVLMVSAMAGFAPSISRAAVMSVILLGAYVLDRENDSLTALGAAAAAICLLNPYAAVSRGLLLSFSSTLSIIIFYPVIFRWLCDAAQSRFEAVNKVLKCIIAAMSLWASAQILTLPIATWFFGYIPSYSLFVNLILSPIVPIIVISAWLTGAFGMAGFSAAASFLGQMADLAGRFTLRLTEITANLPFAAIAIRDWCALLWLFFAAACLIYLRYSESGRVIHICLVAAAFPLLVSLAANSIAYSWCLDITSCTKSGSLILSREDCSVIIDLPEGKSDCGNAVNCAGSKGRRIDVITAPFETQTQASRIIAIKKISPSVAVAPKSLAMEAGGRLDQTTLAPADGSITTALGCCKITSYNSKTLIECNGLRMLKLSYGYDIMENNELFNGLDIIISPDGQVGVLNQNLKPHYDTWGDITFSIKV